MPAKISWSQMSHEKNPAGYFPWNTLPKTNMSPENWWLEDVIISYQNSPFLGNMLVFQGVLVDYFLVYKFYNIIPTWLGSTIPTIYPKQPGAPFSLFIANRHSTTPLKNRPFVASKKAIVVPNRRHRRLNSLCKMEIKFWDKLLWFRKWTPSLKLTVCPWKQAFLQKGNSSSNHPFSGAMLVSGRVTVRP